MSIELFSKYLIRTSENCFLYFHLNDKNNILLDKFNKSNTLLDSKILFNEPVIDFSVDFDDKDIIYILYLNQHGELKYNKIDSKDISSNTITKLDLRSNIYSNFKLIIHKNSIHVFYAYKNYINSKIWTIQHIIGSEGKWTKNTIISISSNQSYQTFHVSFDKMENIHLIYEALENNKQNIYYLSYTPFLQKWNKSPYKLSEGHFNSNQSCLFIDSKDNIHVIWCSDCKSNNTVVQYRQSLALGKFQHKWQPRQLPIKGDYFSYPNIFEENGILKLNYKSNNLIKSLYSHDYGYTWSPGDSFKCPNNVVLTNYLSNIKSYNTKINKVYGRITNKIELYGLSDIFSHNENKIKSNMVKTNTQYQHFTQNDNIVNNIEFNNEEILKFINKTKNDLNNIMKHVKPDIIKKEINLVISKNAKLLDENIKYNKGIGDQVSQNLKDIESLIKNYLNYVKEIENIINSLQETYQKNIVDTKQILNQIEQLNILKERNKNKSIFHKIIDLFK